MSIPVEPKKDGLVKTAEMKNHGQELIIMIKQYLIYSCRPCLSGSTLLQEKTTKYFMEVIINENKTFD